MKIVMLYMLVSLFNFAYGESGQLPKYCEQFGHMDAREYKESLQSQNPNELLYETCSTRGTAGYTIVIKDLMDNYLEIEKQQNAINISSLKRTMSNNAFSKLLEKKNMYLSLVSGRESGESLEEVRKCAREDFGNPKMQKLLDAKMTEHVDEVKSFSKNGNEQKALFEDFMKIQLINSMLVANIEADKVAIEMKYKKLVDKEHSRIFKSGGGRTKMRTFSKIRGKLLKEQASHIKQQDEVLASMVGKNPLLIDTENDFSMGDWFNYKVTPSKLQQELVSSVPSSLQQQFKLAVQNRKFKDFFINNKNAFNKVLQTNVGSKQLVRKVRYKIKQHIDNVNKSLVHICESKGDSLHHFPEYVEEVFAASYGEDKSKKDVVEDMSAYCYLLVSEPKEDLNRITWKTGVGFALIGTGALAQFVPLIGNLTGFGLIAGGSSIIAYEDVQNYITANEEFENASSLHSAGWVDYKRVLDSKNQLYDEMSDVALDGLIVLDGLAFIKGTKHVLKIGAKADSQIARKFYVTEKLSKNSGDAGRFKDVVWKRHKVAYGAEKVDPLLAGKRAQVRDELMYFNKNDGIPAFYRYGKDGDDTFGVIDTFLDPKRIGSDDAVDSLKQINVWIDDYGDYKKLLNGKIDEGFTVHKQLEELGKYRTTSRSTFNNLLSKGDGVVNIKLSTIIDGKVVVDEVPFSTYNQLKSYMRSLRVKDSKVFTSGIRDEALRSSEVFDVMTEHALRARKLTFLRNKLVHIPDAKKSVEQKDLLVKVNSLLKNSDIAPRTDAKEFVVNLELKNEISDILRSAKNKFKLRSEAKYSLSELGVSELKQAGVAPKIAKIFGISVATTGIMATGKSYYTHYKEQGGLGIEIANAEIWLDDVLRGFSVYGATGDEVDCAKSGRAYTFETSCYPALARKYIEPYVLRAMKNPAYKLEKDLEVAGRLKKYRQHMLALRKQFKAGETYSLVQNNLKKDGYKEFSRQVFLDKTNSYAADKDVLKAIEQIFISDTQEEMDQQVVRFAEKYGSHAITPVLFNYLDKETEGISSIKETSRLTSDIEAQLKKVMSTSGSFDSE